MDQPDFGLFDPDPTKAGQQEASLLDQPGARAALLNFGLAAMQPLGAGQTTGGHLARAVGQGAEAMDRSNQLDTADALAQQKLDQGQQKIDLLKDKMGLSQRIKAQGRGKPLAVPQATAEESGMVPIGSSQPSAANIAASGPPAAAPAAVAAAPKPSASDFVTRHPTEWATLKQRAQNGSPAERQSAAEAISRLKGIVADPQTVDQLLAS